MALRDSQRSEKRLQIIQAAARVFARRGFAGTAIADVAAEAGIGKGTTYEYFDSKEDLFFAVFEWFVKDMEAKAKVGVWALSGSAAERLRAFSDTVVNAWAEMEDLYTLVMEFWAASASSEMRDRFKTAFKDSYREFRHLVAALLRDGMERGEFRSDVDVSAVAAALVGTWDALLLQTWFDERFDLRGAAEGFLSALIYGLAASESDR